MASWFQNSVQFLAFKPIQTNVNCKKSWSLQGTARCLSSTLDNGILSDTRQKSIVPPSSCVGKFTSWVKFQLLNSLDIIFPVASILKSPKKICLRSILCQSLIWYLPKILSADQYLLWLICKRFIYKNKNLLLYMSDLRRTFSFNGQTNKSSTIPLYSIITK